MFFPFFVFKIGRRDHGSSFDVFFTFFICLQIQVVCRGFAGLEMMVSKDKSGDEEKGRKLIV